MLPGANRTSPSARWSALGAVLLSLPMLLWLRGFTVDDALIPARVAAHLRAGLGARFNPHGPLVDAVTPLGYAELLSLLSSGGVLGAWRAAKWLGALAYLGAAALVGAWVGSSGRSARRFAPFALLACSAPLSCWAVSGLETGPVTLLATLAVLTHPLGSLAAGAAAALRPELVPWASTLGIGRALFERRAPARAALHLSASLAPALSVALVRQWRFGRPVPLAFYAKPSDFAHGLRYALGGLVFTGFAWLLVSPAGLRRLDRPARLLLGAAAVHVLSLVIAGGDWMPFYRLLVPILPSLAVLGARLAEQSGLAGTALRTGLGLACSLLLAVGRGPSAAAVGRERLGLIERARPVLRGAKRIAALDVGWVGAASSADLIDLAGVTDAQVAFFPGGHTSKRIPRQWLVSREPDRVILLLESGSAPATPWSASRFARQVEWRVARWLAGDFVLAQVLTSGDLRYLVLTPRATASSAGDVALPPERE